MRTRNRPHTKEPQREDRNLGGIEVGDHADIAPIPGTKRGSRLEENLAADAITLTAGQLSRLDRLTPPAGGHHSEDRMKLIDADARRQRNTGTGSPLRFNIHIACMYRWAMAEESRQRQETFERSAAALLERFKHLWRVRDAELIREIVLADAVSHWPQGTVPGHAYPETWRALVVDSGAELDFTVTGHAAREPYLFISWHVRATVGGDSADFDGVDRFRLRGERADEVHVIFNPGPIGDLLHRAAGPDSA